jgi:hypothetical protein
MDGMVKDGNRGVRVVARALALVFISGAILAVLNDTGFGRMLRNAVGYADFGYVPQECATSRSSARALNGDAVRVCQFSWGTTRSWFVGHKWYPIGNADVALHVSMPDAAYLFSFGAYSGGAGGLWRSFTTPVFGSVLAGNPVSASDRFSAWDNGSRYLDVVRTSRITRGTNGYTLTWQIKNTTATTQRIRPMVSSTSYGYGFPVWATAPSPRRIQVRNPTMGGSVTLAESAFGGSPAVTGFTSGMWQRTNAAATPAGGALDNQVHQDRVENGNSSAMSLAWPARSLAPNASATYSVTITLERARELTLALAGAAPTGNAPTTLSARVVEDRAVAGRFVRWRVIGAGGATGAAPIDANKRATLVIPAKAGAQDVRAYVDTNGNGLQDENEPEESGTIYSPAATPPPPPVPTVVATATPTPPPVVEPKRIVVTLGYFLNKSRFRTFSVKDVPAGSTVTAKCPKGCARKTYTKRNARGTVSLKTLVGRKRIKPGTTITVTVSRPGEIGAVKIFTMRKGRKQPKITTRCLAPGAKRATACR